MKTLFQIMLNICGWLLYIPSMLMPKKKGLWVFGSWYGNTYSDNSKFFFEYCNKQNEIRPVWITKNKKVKCQLHDSGLEVYYYLSLKGIYFQTRAECAFITQSVRVDLLSCCISKGTKIVQLWHGLALKKIMYDVPKRQTVIRSLLTLILPYFKHRQDFVVSTSKETSKVFSNAFRIERKNIICTGLPRNDVFFNKSKSKSKSNRRYKVIYMPTFRGGIGDDLDLFTKYKFDTVKVNKLLKMHDIELYIRMHPVNSPPKKVGVEINLSSNIFISREEDIYDTINDYDCLITDFSSIYLDYIISKKPIIFSPFNFDSYIKQDRELYYNYEDVTISPYCLDWDMVVERVISLKENGYTKEEEQKYNQIRELFHSYNDGHASERLFLEIRRLTNEGY